MKIIVLVKEVPDTYGDRKLDLETGITDRDASEKVIDEIGERAVEFAVSYAERNAGTEIVVLSVGPGSVPTTLRKGLAMGATSAVHVLDEGLVAADLTLTSQAIVAAISATGFDLVVAGNMSTDGSGGVMAAMVAERLGLAHLTNLTSAEITEGEVTGERATDGGAMQVQVSLPAVISITERFPDPRFPNFKGIMAAKKKPFTTATLGELGVDADGAASRSIMIAVAARPAREAGVKIVDEGDGGEQLAAFLLSNRLV